MVGKSILKVIFTLTHLSPLGESVVSATSFYKVKDKAQFLHGGCPELVRIQRRIAKKRYLNSKRIYQYGRVSLHIPTKFHETIRPFLKRDLEMKITAQNGSLVIVLTTKNTA
jgi:hypothetical protein